MRENEQNPFQQTSTHSTYEEVSQHVDTTDDDRLFGMHILNKFLCFILCATYHLVN